MGQPVIICGMHRSGTSMIARILAAQGLFIGHRLGKHPEALFFHKLNDRLLRNAGSTWDAPDAALDTMSDPATVARAASEIAPRLRGAGTWSYLGPRLLSARASIGPHLHFPWGWKDPRNSLFLPVWLKLFPAARVLRIRRHGIDVAASLVDRELRREVPGKCRTIADGLRLWAQYETSLDQWLQTVSQSRQMTLRFEDYVADGAVQARVNDFLSLPPPVDLPDGLKPDQSRIFAYRADDDLRSEAESASNLLRAHGYEP